MAEQVHVANGIKDLVDNELIRVTQAVFIENPIVVEDDSVIHTAAKRQIALA